MLTSKKPSEIISDFWVHATAPLGTPPAAQPRTERGGKWMVFGDIDAIDALWDRVRDETEAGRLGIAAKVATSKPNSLAQSRDVRLICVYTYDGDDEADVFRVRELLRALGVTQKIYWKADAATRAGRYGGPGRRVSRYSA